MSKNNGGAAFPCDFNTDTNGSYQKGMSLRDWFAGQALAGFMSSSNLTLSNADYAKAAYETADAMLAARREAQS